MAYSFVTRTRSSRPSTGATWARWTLTTTPTWIFCSVSPVFNLYDRKPGRFRHSSSDSIRRPSSSLASGRTGAAINSVITAGVIISGASVSNSVVSQDGPRQLLLGCGREHHLLPREYRAALPHQEGDYRPRRPHSEGTVIGYDQVEDSALLRDSFRSDDW